MKIVIISDPRKNDLLLNFCVAYRQILKRHELYTTINLQALLEGPTELRFNALPSDIVGSVNQFVRRASYDEIDAVIYLRDPQSADYDMPNLLMKACDTHLIPYAGNLAMAEILVLAIDRGDLDWRNYL